MAKARVQIVRRESDGRWKFIAHGARFSREEAEKWKLDYPGEYRFLPIKESPDGR